MKRLNLSIMFGVLLLVSCKKVNDTLKLNHQFLKLELDNELIDATNNVNGWDIVSVNSYTTGSGGLETTPLCLVSNGIYSIEIEFFQSNFSNDDVHDEKYILNKIFKEKSYAYLFYQNDTTFYAPNVYTVSTSILSTSGVMISVEENGVLWSSALVAQDSNSKFNITSVNVKTESYVDKDYYVKIKGDFSCIVGNLIGESLDINNATFKLEFSAI